MKKEELIGVWKLVDYGDVSTAKTHLVIQENLFWEVWPKKVYYENEPGPEVMYTFDAEEGDPIGRLSLSSGFKYLVKREGDALILKLGPVFGSFPKNFSDRGNVGRYQRERDDLAATLNVLPPKVAIEQMEVKGLGVLTYDDNLDWWTGNTVFQGQKIGLQLSVEEDHKFEPLKQVNDRLQQLAPLAFDQIATDHLLALFNGSWNPEETDLSAEAFRVRVTLASITFELSHYVTVWMKDGDLFGGHDIAIELDANNQVLEVGIMG